MDKTKVREIVNPAAMTGMGSNGKQWTQALVELENGVQTRIFMPINVGDEVESYTSPSKDGTKTFTNWRKPKRASVDLEPIFERLDKLEELSARALKGIAIVNQKLDKLLNMDEPTTGISTAGVEHAQPRPPVSSPSWEAQREKFGKPANQEPVPEMPEDWLAEGEPL
jgi:hypothetical protein